MKALIICLLFTESDEAVHSKTKASSTNQLTWRHLLFNVHRLKNGGLSLFSVVLRPPADRSVFSGLPPRPSSQTRGPTPKHEKPRRSRKIFPTVAGPTERLRVSTCHVLNCLADKHKVSPPAGSFTRRRSPSRRAVSARLDFSILLQLLLFFNILFCIPTLFRRSPVHPGSVPPPPHLSVSLFFRCAAATMLKL